MKEMVRAKLKGLTQEEKHRLIEIDFYQFVRYLLVTYNKPMQTTETLEGLATLFNCNVTLIKRIAGEALINRGRLVPTQQELSVLYYKNKVPIRAIRNNLGTHPQTIYRHIDKYIEQGQQEFYCKLREEEFAVVESFMVQLQKLTRWKNNGNN